MPSATGSAQEPSQQPKGRHSAAAAIRSVQVGKTPVSSGRSDFPITKATTAAPTKRAEPPLLQESSTAPKSAAELLAPFLEDDPKQVFLPDTVRNHAAVQAERVDPEWGPAASQAMRDYLDAQLGNRADLISADCRTDLCELQIVSGLSGNKDADMHDFQHIVAMFHQQFSKALQLDQDSGMVTFAPDGRIVVIWFYSRL
jgi:hypothetical protein